MSNLSIVNKAEWLKAILASPNSLSVSERTEVMAACKSQGALAKYSSEQYQFSGTSLNTMKLHANKNLIEGFSGLDRLRTSVLVTLKKEEIRRRRPTRGSKDDLQRRLNEKEKENQCLINELQEVTVKLEELMRLARTLAKKSNQEDVYIETCRDILSKFKR